jgi:peptidoglycan/LPS O-acetylase OafA/YrhL
MFYLLVPLIFTRIKDFSRALAATLLALGIAEGSYLALVGYPGIPASWVPLVWGQFLWYWLPTQLPILCLGTVLFYAPRSRRLALAALFGFLPLIGLLFVFYGSAGWYFQYPFEPRYMLFGLAFVLLVYGVEQYPIVVNRVTTYFGKISYSCYLLQFAILNLLLNHVDPFLRSSGLGFLWIVCESHPSTTANIAAFGLTLLSALGLTVLVASISCRLIEVPGVRLGRVLLERIERKKAVGISHDTPQALTVGVTDSAKQDNSM